MTSLAEKMWEEGMLPCDGVDLREMLKRCEFDVTETNVDHLAVLLAAMQKFVVRNAQHQDLWKVGAKDSVHHVRHKTARLTRQLDDPFDEDGGPSPLLHRMDDGIDLINYSAFLFRNAAEGRLGELT